MNSVIEVRDDRSRHRDVRRRDGLLWLRLFVTLCVCTNAIDYVANVLVHLAAEQSASPAVAAGQLTLFGIGGLCVVWRHQWWGIGLTALAVVTGALTGHWMDSSVITTGIIAVVVTGTAPLGRAVVGAGVVISEAVLHAAHIPTGADADQPWTLPVARSGTTFYLVFLLCVFTAGLLIRRLNHERRLTAGRIERLDQENSVIREQERAELGDELSRAAGFHLALARELIHDLRDVRDPTQARAGLDEVRSVSRAAVADMRSLLSVLREDPRTSTRPAVVPLTTWGRVRLVIAAVALATSIASHLVMRGSSTTVLVAGLTLGFLAIGAACWSWIAGYALACGSLLVVALTAAPPYRDTPAAALLAFVTPLVAGSVGRAAALTAPLALYLIVRGWRTDQVMATFGGLGVAVSLAFVAGLAARHYLGAFATDRAIVAGLRARRETIRADERRRLARDLHDVVAHQLSVVALQLNVYLADPGASDHTHVLELIDRATAEAQTELDALTSDVPNGPDEADETPLPPSAMAAELAEQLRAAGHVVDVLADPAADLVPATMQRTIGRVLQESTTNALRYAGSGRCTLRVDVTDDIVRVQVRSPLAIQTRRSELSSGYGLRGVRERVDLSGGTMSAGRDGDAWVVDASLPLANEQRSASVG